MTAPDTTGELREAIARAVYEANPAATDGGAPLAWAAMVNIGARYRCRKAADAILALPALRDLLAERDTLAQMLRDAGIEYPLGLRGVSDLVDQRDGHRQRAEEAEAERDTLAAKVQAVEGLAEEMAGHGRALIERPDQMPAFHGRQITMLADRIRRALDGET